MKKRKIKNTILKVIMGIVAFVWCYSACCLDSQSWTPLIVCVITGAILVLFAYENGAFGVIEK